jgi:DMSO/TMAO reductase YedYZ molybdopterin-dependent catalytic subunit
MWIEAGMARRRSVWGGALVGFLGSVVFTGGAFLGQAVAGLPNAPYLVFEWLVRHLPGRLLSFGIDSLIGVIRRLGVGSTARAAKLVEQSMALVLFLAGGTVFGGFLGALGARGRRVDVAGAIGGLLAGVALAVLAATIGAGAAGPILATLWLVGAGLAWGALVGRSLLRTAPGPGPDAHRRFWLSSVVGGGAAALAALAIGRATRAPVTGPAGRAPRPRGAAQPWRPELTANQDFYRVDIDLAPPEVDARAWRLRLDGLVDRPLLLTLADLRGRPAVTQTITLECISNPIGGDLIGTSRWTGVPLRALLREAQVRPAARAIEIEAADGFHESVAWEDAMDDRTLLVYQMNGEPLPAAHGFPLRIYIPDRYGMKQPKWIQRLQAVASPRPGYWVERGWNQEARPRTTAVIDSVDAVAPPEDRAHVVLGGIAFSGARGISRVEVQVDEGPWAAAELHTPPLGPLTWVSWRHSWPRRPGPHQFRVRAFDGQGRLQATTEAPPHPSGATGVHTVTKTV